MISICPVVERFAPDSFAYALWPIHTIKSKAMAGHVLTITIMLDMA